MGALPTKIEPRMHDRTVRAVFKSISQLGTSDDPVMQFMGVDPATCDALIDLYGALEPVAEVCGW